MIGPVLMTLFVLACLAFLAVFIRIGFAPQVGYSPKRGGTEIRPAPPTGQTCLPGPVAEFAAFVEHGFALSEIGMTWAELSQCPGLELRRAWGSGVLALAVREKLAAVELAALERETKAQGEIAHLRRCLDAALGLGVEASGAGGEAADTAQGQGCSAEGCNAVR